MKFFEDSDFIRDNIPMTKEIIRIICINKMNLKKNYDVLDIGAGTGSITCQCAEICKNGTVTAIEKNFKAIKLIKKNIEKFNLKNINLIFGDAFFEIKKIEKYFDVIFIGGSGGNIFEILKFSLNKLNNNGTLILTFITIKNLFKTLIFFDKSNIPYECQQINVTEISSKLYMMKSNNPVFIVKAIKKNGVN